MEECVCVQTEVLIQEMIGHCCKYHGNTFVFYNVEFNIPLDHILEREALLLDQPDHKSVWSPLHIFP